MNEKNLAPRPGPENIVTLLSKWRRLGVCAVAGVALILPVVANASPAKAPKPVAARIAEATPRVAESTQAPKVTQVSSQTSAGLLIPKFGIRDSCVWACPGTPTNANYTPADGAADVAAIGFQEVNVTEDTDIAITGIAPTDCGPDDRAFNFANTDAADRSIAPTGANLIIDFNSSTHKFTSISLSLLNCMGRAFAQRFSGNYPDPLNPGQNLGPITDSELDNEPNLKRKSSVNVVRNVRQYLAWSGGVYSVNPNATVAGAVLAGTAPYSPISYIKDYSEVYKQLAKNLPPPKLFDIHAYPAANSIDTPNYTLSNKITTVNGHTYSRIGDISIANLPDFRQALNDDFGDGQDTRPEIDIAVGETAWFKAGDTNNQTKPVSETTQASYYDQMYKKLISDASNPSTNIGLSYVNWFQLDGDTKGNWRSAPVSMTGPNKDQKPLTHYKLYGTMQSDLKG